MSETEQTKLEEEKLPPIDFSTFVLSMASSVQIHLGLVPNPADNQVEKKMALAKQTIDILGLLQEKTRGNLNPDEEKLLQHLLTDLRMRYWEANK